MKVEVSTGISPIISKVNYIYPPVSAKQLIMEQTGHRSTYVYSYNYDLAMSVRLMFVRPDPYLSVLRIFNPNFTQM